MSNGEWGTGESQDIQVCHWEQFSMEQAGIPNLGQDLLSNIFLVYKWLKHLCWISNKPLILTKKKISVWEASLGSLFLQAEAIKIS